MESIHLNPPVIITERNACPFCSSTEFRTVSRRADRTFALCSTCTGVFNMGKRDPIQYTDEQYHKIFEDPSYQAGSKMNGETYAQYITKLMGHPGTVFEIGAGTLSHLYGWNKMGWDVHGVELSKQIVEKQEYDFKDRIHIADFETSDPIKFGGPYDVVYLNHTWEHFYDVNVQTEKCLELIKPGGYLFIAGPNADKMVKPSYTDSCHLDTLFPSEHWYIPGKKTFEIIAKRYNLKLIGYREQVFSDDSQCILQKPL